MTADVQGAVSPWISTDAGLDDALLSQLAADLGGDPTPPAAVNTLSMPQNMTSPHPLQRQYSVVGQYPAGGLAHFNSLPLGLVQQGSLPQPLMLQHGLTFDPQQLQAFGSAPDAAQHLPNSANSMSNIVNGWLQPQPQPVLMFRPAFGGNGVLAGHMGMADARPTGSKSQSPSTSSGANVAGEESNMRDSHRANKTINKGALAQKRFRERQKEKMRANEVQVAELTRKLGQLEVEKARLASRARLLEQVLSLNLIHEAKLHTNREIMVREQEMLLEDLAAFMLAIHAATNAYSSGNSSGSSPNSPEWLQGTGLSRSAFQLQQQQQGQAAAEGWLLPQQQHQQQQVGAPQLQQQDVLHILQQQQQQQQQHMGGLGVTPGPTSGPSSSSGSNKPNSGEVLGLTQVIRSWTVQTMVDRVFPQYIACLQQLLPLISGSSPDSSSSNAAAAAAQQSVESLVLRRREMTDRHALFSHYYWAVWCFNKGEVASQGLVPPSPCQWAQVLHNLNLSKAQTDAIVSARSSLLSELHRVAADWQRVLPTLALQLLQVPRVQWHTVAAVQAMVNNLAAEREAVVGFLHTLIDEVLTPVQEGRLEASSYPWCPDVWAIAGAAAAAAAAAQSSAQDPTSTDATTDAAGGNSSSRSKGGRKGSKGSSGDQSWQQQAAAATAGGLSGVLSEDPMAALSMGTDVLQPLMPFMTAFQLLREPVTAKGAGLRLKRALLLDPFRTVVPAAAYPQPSAPEVAAMSLLDAHCGTFQQVMLWDWLKANLPSYVTMLGLASSQGTTAATAATAAAAAAAATTQAPSQQQQQQQTQQLQQTQHLQQQQQQQQQLHEGPGVPGGPGLAAGLQRHSSSMMLSQPLGGQPGVVLQHSLSHGNLMGGFMMS